MNESLAFLLKRYRLNCGYSQQMVANTLNIDRSTYTYYETGKSMPSFNTILVLKNLYNIPYDELLQCFDANIQRSMERLRDPSGENNKSGDFEEPDMILLDKSSIYELPKDEQQLILFYRRMNKKDRRELVEKLQEYIQEKY